MAEDKSARDRVRELVRQVLATVPDAEENDAEKAANAEPEVFPKRVVVNSLKDEIGKEFDRDESAKSLITEDDLRGLNFGAKIRVAETARLTPLAQDFVQANNIELVRKQSRRGSLKVKSVAVGSDHGGFPFKEQLKNFLSEIGLQVRDFGTDSTDAVDYPDYAHAVAVAVADRTVDAGIIVDGAGIGSAITANKVPGVRAAACYNAALAKNSREHNGANVLTLGSGQNDFNQVKEIVEAFLSSDLTEERHKKRVTKIEAIEKQYKK
jgi:ribose 5-phosphate isomerase B